MKICFGIHKYKESDHFVHPEGGPSQIPRDMMSAFDVLGLQPAIMKRFLLNCHLGILD